MRTGIITAAVLTLGFAAVPTFVQAGDRHEPDRHETRVEDRHEVRHDVHVDVVPRHDFHVDEHVIVDRDYRHWDHDRVYIPTPVVTVPVVSPVVTVAVNPVAGFDVTPVGLNEVPPIVLNGVAAQTGGAPIVSVDWLHNGPAMYYDVHVSSPDGIHTLRFGRRGVFFGYI